MELLTATDLDEWSNRRDAQAHLPTLVRRLIMATVAPSTIRMAAAEGIRFPGFDGVVEVAGGAPPFVPAGRSVWELGTGSSPSSKAEDDYTKRSESTPAEERATTTFVFVTSREWDGANQWVQSKVAQGDGWAAVVALDAQALATWLETCPGVAGWLASERLGRQPFGIAALREWFVDWSERTEPPIPAALLLCGRQEAASDLLVQLRGPAGERVVSAPSREEAVAFVAATLLAPDDVAERDPVDEAQQPGAESGSTSPRVAATSEALLERTLVVYEAAAWRRWMVHEQQLTLIPLFDDPAIDAAVHAGHHVLLPQIARPGDPALPLLDRGSAREVWENAGVGFPQADELARAARRSLTSLRRRIGRKGRFRRPAWAEGPSANLLATLLLAGAWADDVDSDRDVIVALADRSWRSVARDLAPLKTGDDAPLVERGHRWEFVDIVDAWDALSAALTSEDLDVLHEQIITVLAEKDPLLGLTPEEQRTRALSLEGLPRRRHSSRLRRGMANTLAVLGAIAADTVLPGGRTGEQHASTVVRSLLIGADSIRWRSLSDLLPTLAEGAPDVFLEAVEADLRAADSPVMKLFDEQQDGLSLSASSRHTSLLWALEGLAFSPRHVSRVAVVLARLAERDPGGRLLNRPAESLTSVLHLVFPQSAVDRTTRLQIIDAVRQVAPGVAWALMLGLVTSTDRAVMLARGPRFRDRPRPPEALSYADIAATLDALADRLAIDADADGARWTAALRLVDKLPPEGRARFLRAADDAWPALEQEVQRQVMADLDERINRHARFRDAEWALGEDNLRRLQEFVNDHAVPGPEDGDHRLFDWFPDRGAYDMRTEEGRALLAAARADALRRVLPEGVEGLRRLAEKSDMPEIVGQTLASNTEHLDDEVLNLLGEADADHRMAVGLAQARRSADSSWLRRAVESRPQQAVPLLLTGDIDEGVLSLAGDLPEEGRRAFWARLGTWRVADDAAEAVLQGLLDHDRPFSAIELLGHQNDSASVPVELTVLALKAPAQRTQEKVDVISSPQYVVGELLNKLEESGLATGELADLEWLYLPLLQDSRTPTALYQRLAADPLFFAELVSVIYKQDPPNEAAGATGQAPGDDGADASATGQSAAPHLVAAAWELLREWRSPLPGSPDRSQPSDEQVQAWVDAAKQALVASGRARIASEVIGEALSGPAVDPDGTWPSHAVRNVLEHEQDPDMEQGVAIGRFNQRGVTVRGPYDGGAQERELAAQYREWADRVRDHWPRSGALLDGLAAGYETEARHHDESVERNSEL